MPRFIGTSQSGTKQPQGHASTRGPGRWKVERQSGFEKLGGYRTLSGVWATRGLHDCALLNPTLLSTLLLPICLVKHIVDGFKLFSCIAWKRGPRRSETALRTDNTGPYR